MGASFDRRRVAALCAVAAASVASVASLDEAPPPKTITSSPVERSAAITEAAPQLLVPLRVTTTDPRSPITLTVRLTATWAGFASGIPGDPPIVEATLARAGATAGPEVETLHRAIPTAPGKGELILSVDASCPPSPPLCSVDFTLAIDRIESVPSGPVTVTWTALASIESEETNPTVVLAVTP